MEKRKKSLPKSTSKFSRLQEFIQSTLTGELLLTDESENEEPMDEENASIVQDDSMDPLQNPQPGTSGLSKNNNANNEDSSDNENSFGNGDSTEREDNGDDDGDQDYDGDDEGVPDTEGTIRKGGDTTFGPVKERGNVFTFDTDSGRFRVSVLKRSPRKYSKFNLTDQLFDLSLKVIKENEAEGSLLKDTLEILHKAITEAVRVIQNRFKNIKFNHQLYLTIVDKDLMNRGINTAHFSLQENPSIMADTLLTKLR